MVRYDVLFKLISYSIINKLILYLLIDKNNDKITMACDDIDMFILSCLFWTGIKLIMLSPLFIMFIPSRRITNYILRNILSFFFFNMLQSVSLCFSFNISVINNIENTCIKFEDNKKVIYIFSQLFFHTAILMFLGEIIIILTILKINDEIVRDDY
jgi:hypothetical protein